MNLNGKKGTILIVDDEKTNRQLLTTVLEDEYETLVAKDGKQALQRARAKEQPDLILLDVSMPGMDGYEACRQLKNDPFTSHIPVIFVTGRGSIEDETMGLSLGAVDYIAKPYNPVIVLARVKNHLELKNKVSALQAAMEEVQNQKNYIEYIFNVLPHGLITFDYDDNVLDWNASFITLIERWSKNLGKDTLQLRELFLNQLQEELQHKEDGEYSLQVDQTNILLEFHSASVPKIRNVRRVVSLRDITELTTIKRRLAQVEKLESVGRLAAGIAHEINTPTQYVVANMEFLDESCNDIDTVMDTLSLLWDAESKLDNSTISELKTCFNALDWQYLKSEIPKALSQSREGLQKIQSIVAAMKQFSQPTRDIAEPGDLNNAIKNTVTVTENEWKSVADIELDLDPTLPTIPCYIDQFNQVILNMIINSVHAIKDVLDGSSDTKGKIVIGTQQNNGFIEVKVSDSGTGMTDSVKEKIFDPFFTTKEVKAGTGQGLSIANDIIVNKHKGEIEVYSAEGKGATFVIRLPVAA